MYIKTVRSENWRLCTKMRSSAWFLFSALLATASAIPMEVSQRPALCSQPAIKGDCEAIIHRFAFHPVSGSCLEFIYGGCNGNANNFASLADCQATCPYNVPRPVYIPPKNPQDNKTPSQSSNQRPANQGSLATNGGEFSNSQAPQDGQRPVWSTTPATISQNPSRRDPPRLGEQPRPTQIPSVTRNPPATPGNNCEGVSCPNNDYLNSFYSEVGCKPVFRPGNPCCAISYDCSTKRTLRADRCYHDNREYTIGQEIPESEQPKCNVHCKCEKSDNDQFPRIRCVTIECAEIFHGAPLPGCKRQYTPDKCCATSTICAPRNASEPLKQCDYEGKKYMEGEKFVSARHPCVTCYCKKQKNGLLEPECQQGSCSLQYNSPMQIRQNCVPIFYKDTCCPVDYKCADDIRRPAVTSTTEALHQNVAITLPAANTPSNNACVFGARHFLVGETLSEEFGGECTRCKCLLPPHPTCVRDFEDCVKTGSQN